MKKFPTLITMLLSILLFVNVAKAAQPTVINTALSGYRLPFVGKHIITNGPGCGSTHLGRSSEAIDFSMSIDTPVYATQSGEIVFAVIGAADNNNNDGFGNLMKVKHDDGNTSWYAHLASFVKTSGPVDKGVHIANSGNTGQSLAVTTGPHLHFEVRNSSNQSIWIREMPGITWYSGDPNKPCQPTGQNDGEAVGPPLAGGTTLLKLNVTLREPPKYESSINKNPLHPQRPIFVQIYNSNNQIVFDKQSLANYDPGLDRFLASLDLGGNWQTGPYQVKVRLDYTLRKVIPGIATITNGATNDMPQVHLTAGDINQDNKVDILDYNILMDCFSDLQPPKNCSDPNKKRAADITDDGKVNQYDYNLFLKIMQNPPPED